MKARVSFFLVSLFLLSSCLGCSLNKKIIPNGSKDNIQRENYFSWDFGQIKSGEVLSHDFVIKNNSSKILQIKDITTSCGCTVSRIGKRILKVQEATFLRVSFNSQGYSGSTEQFIYVSTDDLDNPILKFIIKANIE